MDVARALREARQHAGLSQRELAQRSGVSARTVAAVEAGRRGLTVRLLAALLAECSLELTVAAALAPVEESPGLREHLRLSVHRRLVVALEETGRASDVLHALSWLAYRSGAALEGPVAVPLWLPGAALTLPLPVLTSSSRAGGIAEQVTGLLDVRMRPGTATDLLRGLIPLRLPSAAVVGVSPPWTLLRDPCSRPWWPALHAACDLLHKEIGLDNGDRRQPPHRVPDEDEEARRMSHTLRYGGILDPQFPSVADGRAWRLGAPASLPQWLEEQDLPPLRGQRRRRS